MSAQLLLPKFLTQGVAESAIVAAVDMTFRAMPVKREMLHVVVLVPEMYVSRKWPDYPIRPFCIAQISFGNKAQWPHKFDEIAQCKALQAWHERNEGSTDAMPHLLFPNDTPFWGCVKRHGIVVGASGVEPWFDRMVAGVTADICIARAYHAWMLSDDRKNGVDFLT